MAIEPSSIQPPDSEFCLVLVTVPNETAAKSIAHSILNAELAACINFFGIESCYRWENKIIQELEVQLMIKTQSHLFPAIAAKLTAIHPYDIPEIIAIPIVAGAPAYLNWIRRSTAARHSPGAIPGPSAIPG